MVGSLLLLFTLLLTGHTDANTVKPSCAQDAELCEFTLVLQYNTTMVRYSNADQGMAYPLVALPNGSWYERDTEHCQLYGPLEEQELLTTVTGDGSYKTAMLYNGSLPGPPVVVYQGQRVVVKLINKLPNEATTLHFHGLTQRNTPWMDGAGGISQCPINPGETFTYRFLAESSGTFWYHSHYGTQRTMGAYGPLIILDRSVDDLDRKRGSDPLPEFDEEFYLVVSDWMHEPSLDIAQRVGHEAVSFSYGYDSDTCFDSTKQGDGTDCGVTPFVSALINGKGRHYDRESSNAKVPTIPLERFTVKKPGKYRFRIINAAMTFGFRVSIDNHSLKVIASDSSDFLTREVESVVIYSGERYDFWLDAKDPEGVGNYWIRAENLERMQGGKRIQAGHTEAILHYEGGEQTEPETTREQCTLEHPCHVLNCPFREFPDEEFTECIPLTALRSTTPVPTHKPEVPDDFHEVFLNFHFTGRKAGWRSSINGIQHVQPASPPQIYPRTQYLTPCDDEHCNAEHCKCTHVQHVPLGNVVQLILATTVSNPVGTLNGNAHQVHLHGHSFQVVKIGWPTYDPVTKYYTQRNMDIDCGGTQLCRRVSWHNQTWSGGNVPGIITEGAPLKDTLTVPVGGYVVVRFIADNPGYWYMHCHTEFHNLEGMALYFKVGEISEMNAPPGGMTQCDSFDWTEEQFDEMLRNPVSILAEDPGPCRLLVKLYQRVSLAFAALDCFTLFSCIYLWCSMKPHKGYTYLPPAE